VETRNPRLNHAVQGNCDVWITALETSMVGKLQFLVRIDMKSRWPRVETTAAFMWRELFTRACFLIGRGHKQGG
jgi:acetamidase/formamidase